MRACRNHRCGLKGVALVGINQLVNPATKIEQCKQNLSARHTDAKCFVLDHPVSSMPLLAGLTKSAHIHKHSNETRAGVVRSNACIQHIHWHWAWRSLRSGMRYWHRSGARGNTLTSTTETHQTKKTRHVHNARPRVPVCNANSMRTKPRFTPQCPPTAHAPAV